MEHFTLMYGFFLFSLSQLLHAPLKIALNCLKHYKLANAFCCILNLSLSWHYWNVGIFSYTTWLGMFIAASEWQAKCYSRSWKSEFFPFIQLKTNGKYKITSFKTFFDEKFQPKVKSISKEQHFLLSFLLARSPGGIEYRTSDGIQVIFLLEGNKFVIVAPSMLNNLAEFDYSITVWM